MAERYQATYSSTPASLIYAQSWPVPAFNSLGKRYPEKLASNSHRKSLNCPWIYEENKYRTTSPRAGSRTEKTYSWAKSMLNNHYPEWVEEDAHVKLDMAKEFRLTLQMFKKLTQQVQDVDEQFNSRRKPCSFKHYFNSNDSSGLYRSQLHLAANKRNYKPQPCNNFREQIECPQSDLEVYRKNHKFLNCISKPKVKAFPSSNVIFQNKSKTFKAEKKKSFGDQTYKLTLKDELLKKYDSSSDLAWPSSPDEDDDFGYIDPVPSDWNERKLEELEEEFSSEIKDETDPFILRYLTLRRLEAETVESEKCCPKSEEIVENVLSLSGPMKTVSASKSQTKKSCNSGKNSTKSKDEKIMKSSEKSFKKSGCFKSDLEFSCTSKSTEVGKLEKEVVCRKEKKLGNAVCCSSKRGKCLSARGRKDRSKIDSRNSHQSCLVAHYDIIELASTFEPPSKDRINAKSRPVTAKSAKSKGLLPGKSWHSQRRFSLTTDKTPQLMAPDVQLTKSKTSKGRQKSAKRKTRRCASSKL